MEALVCRASSGEKMVYVAVRGDGTPPKPFTPFSQEYPSLMEVNFRDGLCWQWFTSKIHINISNEQRLRLLLGETIQVEGWTVSPI